MDPFIGITYKRRKVGPSTITTPKITTSLDDLKDDELIEILIKLPLDCVHRSKCVSKRWLGLISDPCFIRSYIQCRANLPQREQFILYHIIKANYDDFTKRSVYGHVSMPQNEDNNVLQHQISDLDGKFFDFSFSRCPLKLKYLRSFDVMRISHGLLLCKAEYKPVARKPPRVGVYHVCNPLTKQWLKIPPLHRHWSFKVWLVGFMCYALDKNLPHMIDFTVLEVENKRSKQDNHFYTRVFSSNTGCWSTYRVACTPGPSWSSEFSGPHYYASVVVYRGMFHWSGGSWLVAYDPDNDPYKCNLIPFPGASNHHHHLVVTEGGHIRLVAYQFPFIEFSVNELTDYDNGKWCVKYVVKFPIWYDEFAFFGQTHEEIACIIRCYYTTHTSNLVMLDMKSGSILSESRIVPAQSYSAPLGGARLVALPYSVTSWPTILPELP